MESKTIADGLDGLRRKARIRAIGRFWPNAAKRIREHGFPAPDQMDLDDWDALAAAVGFTADAIGKGLLSDTVRNVALAMCDAMDCRADDSAAADTGKPGKRMSKESKALAALIDHPDWTDDEIAKAADCKRTSLYAMKKYVNAKKVMQAGRDELPQEPKRAAGTFRSRKPI